MAADEIFPGWVMTRWSAPLAAICAVAALAAPAAAQVPDPFARQLAQALAQNDAAQSDFGYVRAAGPFAGGLSAGMSRRFPVTLRAGQTYRAIGVCDARCGDLDMRLFDPSGALISQDTLPDRTPVTEVNPQFTGGHVIEVQMTRCADAPCYFAFNVYARR